MIPIRWHTFDAATGAVAVAWLVWVQASPAQGGGQWIEVSLMDSSTE